MRAPRALACSSDSMTRMPAPSPMTKPSRSLSHGRQTRRPFLHEHGVLIFGRFQSADAAADDAAEALGIAQRSAQSRIGHRALRGGDGEVGEAIRAVHILRGLEMFDGLEVAHFPGD